MLPAVPTELLMIICQAAGWCHNNTEGTNTRLNGVTTQTNLTTELLPAPALHVWSKVLDPKLAGTLMTTLGLDKLSDWLIGSAESEVKELRIVLYFMLCFMIIMGVAAVLMLCWCVRKEKQVKRRQNRRPEQIEMGER